MINYLKKIDSRINRDINKRIGKRTYQAVMKAEPEYGLSHHSEPVIVSMASYAARYPTIIPTLKSLILQSYKPDRIIVWLDEDKPENAITDEMREFEKYGVEYRYTNDDLKPHKKYFYAMQEFKNAIIITVDDDLVYSKDLIKSLMAVHERYPNCICARRVHKMHINSEGNIQQYNQWEREYRWNGKPSLILCTTGGAGALYPARILPEETFDIDKIKNLCWRADDIWLKFMELKAGIPTVWVPTCYVMPYVVKGSQETALKITNANQGGNDEYIGRILTAYPEIEDRINEKRESKRNNPMF